MKRTRGRCRQQAVLKLLCERARPDIYDAAELNLVRQVRRLLDDDPSLAQAPDGKGAPSRIAAAAGRFDLVKPLLERGADTRARNPQDRSALDLARSRGHAKILQLLEGM